MTSNATTDRFASIHRFSSILRKMNNKIATLPSLRKTPKYSSTLVFPDNAFQLIKPIPLLHPSVEMGLFLQLSKKSNTAEPNFHSDTFWLSLVYIKMGVHSTNSRGLRRRDDSIVTQNRMFASPLSSSEWHPECVFVDQYT
jgi:hypothetical protein